MYAHCDIERAKKKYFFSEILKIDVFRAIFRFSYIFFVFACYQATGHNFLHMNLNFGMMGPQDMCNDDLFQFSKIFIFSLLGPFCCYSLYILCIFHRSHYWTYKLNSWRVTSLWHRKSKNKKLKRFPKFWKLTF